MSCLMDDCDAEARVKGYCKRHYQQQWQTGSPVIKRPIPRGTPEERFWKYTDKRSEGACWNWVGNKDKDGYGTLRLPAANVRAHRFSYQLHSKEAIPPGMIVRHLCNNPPCVNPTHLALGTHRENMQDRKRSGHYLRGEEHHCAKFSDETVARVRVASGTSRQIAKDFGISEAQVSNIKRDKQRTNTFTKEAA